MQGIFAYLSSKTTRGWDEDSGYQLCPFIYLESENHMTLVYKYLVNKWESKSTNRNASSAVSHQGLALSQQLSHQVGARDAWVSHHVTCHLTHHMTSLMIHHMTCMWHITWLITWLFGLRKENKLHAVQRWKMKNVPWDKSSHWLAMQVSPPLLSPSLLF
jgi:hypothetical protein